MLKLMKWLVLGGFAYFVYTVVRGIDFSGAAKKAGALAQAAAPKPEPSNPRINITGGGKGMDVPVHDPDGAAHMTKVGRGVLR